MINCVPKLVWGFSQAIRLQDINKVFNHSKRDVREMKCLETASATTTVANTDGDVASPETRVLKFRCIRVATIREKSGKNKNFSRSGNSQGIFQKVREKSGIFVFRYTVHKFKNSPPSPLTYLGMYAGGSRAKAPPLFWMVK